MPQRPANLLQLDPYVVDTLMPDLVRHDRQASAFLVYLFLLRQAQSPGVGSNGASVQVALRDVADGTGLSKRAVQDALLHLARRELVSVAREGITGIATYTVRKPWRR
jgi:CRP-like cAMP-binding protein